MMRRIRGAWSVLTGRAQAVIVECEERPAVFFDDRDLAVIGDQVTP